MPEAGGVAVETTGAAGGCALGGSDTAAGDGAVGMSTGVRRGWCRGGGIVRRDVVDFERMAEIAHEVGAYLMVDMAHIAGLVAAGLHPSPVPHADIVTSTSHKTLRGPRGGFILTNSDELGPKINKAIFPGAQGGPLHPDQDFAGAGRGHKGFDELEARRGGGLGESPHRLGHGVSVGVDVGHRCTDYRTRRGAVYRFGAKTKRGRRPAHSRRFHAIRC